MTGYWVPPPGRNSRRDHPPTLIHHVPEDIRSLVGRTKEQHLQSVTLPLLVGAGLNQEIRGSQRNQGTWRVEVGMMLWGAGALGSCGQEAVAGAPGWSDGASSLSGEPAMEPARTGFPTASSGASLA